MKAGHLNTQVSKWIEFSNNNANNLENVLGKAFRAKERETLLVNRFITFNFHGQNFYLLISFIPKQKFQNNAFHIQVSVHNCHL